MSIFTERREFAETVTEHYLICALWTSELDDVGVWELPDETWTRARTDCYDFVRKAWRHIRESGMEADHVGHNFWLTRNGHGVGFWDRGLGDVGERLTEASEAFGDTWMEQGDDELVYLS